MAKPPCIGPLSDNVLGTIIGVAGVSAIVVSILLIAAAEALEFGGVAVASGAGFAAAGMVFVLVMHSPGCDPGPIPGCVAGIVNSIDLAGEFEGSFTPWLEGHPSVQLVTKSAYWPFLMKPLGEGETEMVGTLCASDGRKSPLIICYYYSERVCRSYTGAVVGAVAGGIGGIYLSILIATALACNTFIFCLFALIIAAIVTAVTTLVGAIVGGQAGAAAGTPQAPEESEDGVALHLGDYVTLNGNFADTGRHVLTGWFVKHTSLHGRSVLNPPYSYLEADAAIQHDDCLAN